MLVIRGAQVLAGHSVVLDAVDSSTDKAFDNGLGVAPANGPGARTGEVFESFAPECYCAASRDRSREDRHRS